MISATAPAIRVCRRPRQRAGAGSAASWTADLRQSQQSAAASARPARKAGPAEEGADKEISKEVHIIKTMCPLYTTLELTQNKLGGVEISLIAAGLLQTQGLAPRSWPPRFENSSRADMGAYGGPANAGWAWWWERGGSGTLQDTCVRPLIAPPLSKARCVSSIAPPSSWSSFPTRSP